MTILPLSGEGGKRIARQKREREAVKAGNL
jgi:hypothetical protein